MHPTHRTIGLGLLVLAALVLLYYVWDYLIGFLAVIGAAQVYRVWRIHYRNSTPQARITAGALRQPERSLLSTIII